MSYLHLLNGKFHLFVIYQCINLGLKIASLNNYIKNKGFNND